MSPPETPWSPFRGLSETEQNSFISSGSKLVCTECGEKIRRGSRMMRSARLPGDRIDRVGLISPTLHTNRLENWKHVSCPT